MFLINNSNEQPRRNRNWWTSHWDAAVYREFEKPHISGQRQFEAAEKVDNCFKRTHERILRKNECSYRKTECTFANERQQVALHYCHSLVSVDVPVSPFVRVLINHTQQNFIPSLFPLSTFFVPPWSSKSFKLNNLFSGSFLGEGGHRSLHDTND